MAKQNLKHILNVSKPLPKKSDARSVISNNYQLYRIRTDLESYRNAVIAAESIINPQRYRLYQVYKSCELDAHLSACVQQRKNLILCRDYEVKDKNGDENEEKTKIIKAKWFRDLLVYAIDSLFWSHSLVQLDDIVDDKYKCVDLIPRIYVKPEKHIVTTDPTSITGQDYLEKPFSDWCIGIGSSTDLGLYLKAAPLVIWKKNAIGAWAEFIEKFGSPIRIGKTDNNDLEAVNNMENMLRNLGQSAWGVFRTDDIIELIESANRDSFQVYDMMIQRCNSEISKLILGQTGTMDEKAYVGSAEVQERVLEYLSDTDEYFINGVLNDQLVPLMIKHGLLADGDHIYSEEDTDLTIQEKAKIDIDFINTGKFTMDVEYIKEKYNTDLIPVSDSSNIGVVKNKLEELYGK